MSERAVCWLGLQTMNLLKTILQLLVLTLDSDNWSTVEEDANFKFGTLQDKRDIEL